MNGVVPGPTGADDPGVIAAAAQALDLIPEGARVGLGTGRAASVFIRLLGARVRAGFRISGVATSRAAADEARAAGVPLAASGIDGGLDITVDGADEVAPNLDLIKGWGGALVRERIVAAASARQVIVVGAEKLVHALGERGALPVEVIPLAVWLAAKECRALGLAPTRRIAAGGTDPFVTDNGNHILDCALLTPLAGALAARRLQRSLRGIAGVVDTGLFLGTATQVLVGHRDGHVEWLARSGR